MDSSLIALIGVIVLTMVISTRHHSRTWCPVTRACLVSCRFGELSQQCVPPHSRQVRRWTHSPPTRTRRIRSTSPGRIDEMLGMVDLTADGDRLVRKTVAVFWHASLAGGGC